MAQSIVSKAKELSILKASYSMLLKQNPLYYYGGRSRHYLPIGFEQRIKSLRSDIRDACTHEIQTGKIITRRRHGKELIGTGKTYKEALVSLRNAIKAYRQMLKKETITTAHRLVSDDLSPYVKRVGGLMVNFPEIREAYINRALFRSKKPLTNEPHIAVEIECIGNTSQQELARALVSFRNYVTIKDDGSLREEEFSYAMEIVVCLPESKIFLLVDICKVLSDAGMTVNKSCGLHVHLDARESTCRNAKAMYARLMKVQELLLQMQPVSRRSNQYCKKSKPNFYGNERYRAVNPTAFRKHGTIEVRCHSGSVDAGKITRWVYLLMSIALNPAIDSMQRFRIGKASLKRITTPSLASYALERVAKFKDASAMAS